MKSLTQSPAVLTVHQGTHGQYIIRVADLRFRPLVVGVTKLLPDAASFVVITPSDIKVFAVGDNGSTPTEVDSVNEEIDAETLAAIAAEEGRSVPGEVQSEVDHAGGTQEDVPPVRARKRSKPASVAGHDEACGRCGGTGKTKVILDGGSPAETSCAICKGSGTMTRYGARR